MAASPQKPVAKSVDRLLRRAATNGEWRLPDSHAELFERRVATPSIRRILGAAVGCFAKQGFHGSTTRDIAAKAGLSPAAVYMHFSSKEQLLYTIALIVAEWVLDELQRAEREPGSPRERLRRLVQTHVACHASMHTAVHVANFEFQALESTQRRKIAKVRDATEKVFADCLEAGVAAGEFDPEELRMTMIAIVSLGVSVSRWFATRGRLTPAQLGDRYATLVLRLAGAP